MNRIVLSVCICIVAVGLVITGFRPAEAQNAEKSKTFILNLTSGANDVHAAWMGLRLAEHALDDDRDVVIFLNVHAPPLASTNAPSSLRFADHPPLPEYLAELATRGAKIIACPNCMKSTGVAEEDLIPGVTIANREKLFGMMEPNTVVFSY